MSEVTSKNVIEFMEKSFIREGYPEEMTSDNSPQFCSQDVETYLSHRNIHHCKNTVYNPRANGLVERVNRIVKESIQLAAANGRNVINHVNKMLWANRTSIRRITGLSPFELLRKRKLKLFLLVTRQEVLRMMRRHCRRLVKSKSCIKSILIRRPELRSLMWCVVKRSELNCQDA